MHLVGRWQIFGGDWLDNKKPGGKGNESKERKKGGGWEKETKEGEAGG